MMKSYLEQVKDDVKQWIEDNKEYYYLNGFESADELADFLSENLIDEDSVTGNGSGYYTDPLKSKEYVYHDGDTVVKACKGYSGRTIAEKFLYEDWEWFDVMARLYVFNDAVHEVAKEIFKGEKK